MDNKIVLVAVISDMGAALHAHIRKCERRQNFLVARHVGKELSAVFLTFALGGGSFLGLAFFDPFFGGDPAGPVRLALFLEVFRGVGFGIPLSDGYAHNLPAVAPLIQGTGTNCDGAPAFRIQFRRLALLRAS